MPSWPLPSVCMGGIERSEEEEEEEEEGPLPPPCVPYTTDRAIPIRRRKNIAAWRRRIGREKEKRGHWKDENFPPTPPSSVGRRGRKIKENFFPTFTVPYLTLLVFLGRPRRRHSGEKWVSMPICFSPSHPFLFPLSFLSLPFPILLYSQSVQYRLVFGGPLLPPPSAEKEGGLSRRETERKDPSSSSPFSQWGLY